MKRKLKITYNAPVILSFVMICFVATIVGIITNNRSTWMLFSVCIGPLSSPLTYIRVFTHVLGHAGFEHFIGNAMYLLLVGPMLEEKYGSNAMIKVIVATALANGIIHCILFGNSSLCGASGVVFACIVLASFTSFKEGEIPMSFILVRVFFIGKEIYSGLVIADSISNLTHIIGGVVSGVLGYSFNKKP